MFVNLFSFLDLNEFLPETGFTPLYYLNLPLQSLNLLVLLLNLLLNLFVLLEQPCFQLLNLPPPPLLLFFLAELFSLKLEVL